jgi:hypothetical protein
MTPRVETVEEAQRKIADLEAKRAALLNRGQELDQVRASYAYAAHANGDAAARAKLDKVNRETAEHGSELASIDAALATARRKLDAASAAEIKAADRAKAQELREVLASFVAAGRAIDVALKSLVSNGEAMRDAITRMNQLGSTHPSHAQLDSLGAIAVRTALTNTPWSRHFERVGPMERKTFAALVAAWSPTVENNIKRLDDDMEAA